MGIVRTGRGGRFGPPAPQGWCLALVVLIPPGVPRALNVKEWSHSLSPASWSGRRAAGRFPHRCCRGRHCPRCAPALTELKGGAEVGSGRTSSSYYPEGGAGAESCRSAFGLTSQHCQTGRAVRQADWHTTRGFPSGHNRCKKADRLMPKQHPPHHG